MVYGSGVHRALKEVCLWAGGIAVCVGSFVFYDDISPLLSKTLQYAEDQYVGAQTASLKEKNSGQISSANSSERRVEIKINDKGHFETEASINGYDIQVMTDTGATVVALTYETADKLGLNPQSLKYSGLTQTANGVAKVAPVILDKISIGEITVKNVQAIVTEQGKLSVNLLGMSFIQRLSRVEMQNGYLLFVQ